MELSNQGLGKTLIYEDTRKEVLSKVTIVYFDSKLKKGLPNCFDVVVGDEQIVQDPDIRIIGTIIRSQNARTFKLKRALLPPEMNMVQLEIYNWIIETLVRCFRKGKITQDERITMQEAALWKF
jgi:hypothetical protein